MGGVEWRIEHSTKIFSELDPRHNDSIHRHAARLDRPSPFFDLGLHKLFVHLVFSTIDVNYIGYSRGSSGIVPLSGNLTISQ